MPRRLNVPAGAWVAVPSPLGEIVAACTNSGLCYLCFSFGWGPVVSSHRFRLEEFLQPDQVSLAATVAWVQAYFGEGAPVPEPRLDLRGSQFELQVWQAVRQVPRGATTTYGEIATRLGDASLARAVGAAISQNPICLIVPCHRVVSSTGKLVGYAGGLERKRRLLEMEGALEPLRAIPPRSHVRPPRGSELSGAARQAAKVE